VRPYHNRLVFQLPSFCLDTVFTSVLKLNADVADGWYSSKSAEEFAALIGALFLGRKDAMQRIMLLSRTRFVILPLSHQQLLINRDDADEMLRVESEANTQSF
jgi:hypothetical protein